MDYGRSGGYERSSQYRQSGGYGRDYFEDRREASSGAAVASSLSTDELALDGILTRLTAAEAATARLRGKLISLASQTAPAPAPATAGVSVGEQVLREKCATCHAAGGKGAESLILTAEDGSWVPNLLEHRSAITDSILSGKMPKTGELTPDETRALLELLYREE